MQDKLYDKNMTLIQDKNCQLGIEGNILKLKKSIYKKKKPIQ